MRSWPEISFRYPTNEVYQKGKGKVNLFPGRTESGGATNFARCTRVLRKLDSCPGEKSVINMSTTQNLTTASRNCNTRELLWAEDFIDLSEFCQPSTIPTKMEDSVDENVTSPISSTVRNHGFHYAFEANDGVDNNTEDDLWYMSSPIAMQEELCDPISDWLAATKETNNNFNPRSRTETSYNINDTFLSTRHTSVPNVAQYNKKSTSFSIDDPVTSPLQPDTTCFQSESLFDTRNPVFTENILLNKSENSGLPPADSLFKEKKSNTSFNLPNRNHFFDRTFEVPSLTNVTVNVNVPSPCSVQSPSITQSNINQEEKSQPSLPLNQNMRLKLEVSDPPRSSSCTMNSPEILQPFTNKNSEFDLVSYVFEDNKTSLPFDISNIPSNITNDENNSISKVISSTNKNNQSITIKTEPNEEVEEKQNDVYLKRKLEASEEDHNNKLKRNRRYSNCSSDDLTQLESEKYRELRNKNNEASRRSRANRKNREVEMKEHASKLEMENRRLKVKAEEMEKLVKRLRNCLMQLVLKRR